MTKLYRVNRGHYCGPSALAAVTGQLADAMCLAINNLRGDPLERPITGVRWAEMGAILRRLGYVVHIIRLPAKPRPLRVIDLESRLGLVSTYIIETATHFMAFRDGLIVDNHTPDGELLGKHPKRRAHVDRVALVQSPHYAEREWLANQLFAEHKRQFE